LNLCGDQLQEERIGDMRRYDVTYMRLIMPRRSKFILLLVVLLPVLRSPALYAWFQAGNADNQGSSQATGAKVLPAPEAAKFLPGTVFFRGQSAPIQARNSGGVQFSKDELFLVALVDTAGYSSSVQEKYQAYLITETAIDIEGHRLPPGAYGCGFLSGDVFLVMDIGGHDLFSVQSAKDVALRRPTPLQVLPSPADNGYRLYVGRQYVKFAQTGH
jgi:hypothetical protein